ncbi:hypothetical protein [Actinomadura chokoriensis]|uniref:hypothetical protein n=1 Tax=Actinomadura chokoriensis TaxID=454156 RepID=UPI0031F8D4FB
MYSTAIAQLRNATFGQLLTGKPLLLTALAGTLALTLSSGTAGYKAAESNLTWSVPLSGVSTAVNSQVFIGTAGPWWAQCDSVRAKVSARRGTGLSGNGIVSIDSVELKNSANARGACTAPQGYEVTIVAAGLPWKFNARAYDARTGITTGRVSGITINAEVSNGCHVTVTDSPGDSGGVDATYDNSTGEITVFDYTHLSVSSFTGSCSLQGSDQVVIGCTFRLAPYGIIRSP